MRNIAHRWSVAVVVAVLLLALPVAAQRLDGSLRGEVLDPSGAVVAGAKVTATNEATGVSNTTTTTSAGSYVFPQVLPGSYTVTVEATGFRTFTRKNAQVNANQTTSADAKLSLPGAEQTVEVVAGAEVLQTTESQLATTFNERVISDAPIASLGGSPLELGMLIPNTTSTIGGVTGDGGSVGGLRPRANSFSLDGADNNDITTTGSSAPVIQDAVQEMNIITNQFSAEYGFAGGGQFNMVTKSGTNAFHGEGHWYNRNKTFNALDNLEKGEGLTEAPRNDYNRLGGSIGGPIIKNRMFFFGAYEFQNQGLQSTGIPTGAPTAEGLATLNTLAANDVIRGFLQQFPTAASATDTLNVNGTPIPIGEITIITPQWNRSHSVQGNVDFNLSRHQLRGRYLFTKFNAPNPNLSLPLPQFDGFQPVKYHTAIFSDAWSMTDRIVNEFRLSFNRSFAEFTVGEGFEDFPNILIGGLSNFDLGPQQNSPQSGGQNLYQIQNNITFASGRHTWKFGGEYRRWIAPSTFLPRSRGEWDYGTLQEFINDEVPSNVAIRNVGSGSFNGNMHGTYWFVQDDFKVTPRLTVNLGVRYDWTGNPADVNTQELNAVSTLPGVFEFRKPKTDNNNFAPRVGFAWDVTGDGKWAIRGGAGMSYYNTFQNLALNSLPPQLQTEMTTGVTCSGLAGTPPAWCDTGTGFHAGGGLLTTHLPPTTQEEARASTSSYIVDQKQPEVYTWTLGVQRELFKNTSLELRYLGTRSTHLPVQTRLNNIDIFEYTGNNTQIPLYFSEADVPATVASPAVTMATYYGPYLLEGCSGLRFCDEGFFGSVTSFPGIGSSTYHGGSADFIHRFNRGLYLRANYTFAKTLDDSSNELFSSRVNPRRSQDAFNIDGEWGRSAMDIRHKAAIAWVYDIPSYNGDSGVLKAVLGGWQLNGSYMIQSGQPVTALSDADLNGDFDVAGDRAIFNPNGTRVAGTGINYVFRDPASGATSIVGADFFDSAATNADFVNLASNIVGYVAADPTAQYVAADLGVRSNLGRNTIDTPGLNLWNMALFKNTKLTEGTTLQFRWETYNTFNHRNFSLAVPTAFTVLDPGNALSSAYSNASDSAFLDDKQFSGGARSMQLGVKLIF